jgi:N-acetylneuraminic acid mutarotase
MKKLLLVFCLFSSLLCFGQWTEITPKVTASFWNNSIAYNGRVYFAGGLLTANFNGNYTDKVSYVDLATETTVTLPIGLSKSRAGIMCAAYDNKIYFAGGYKGTTQNTAGLFVYDIIDIYDITTETWLPAKYLSTPRGFGAAAVVNGKIMFAGGYYLSGSTILSSDVVDILDATTGEWLPIQHLSEGRNDFQAAVIGNKVWFCGGVIDYWSTMDSDVVDIYDADTNTWSVDHLSQAREGAAVVAIGQYIVCSGGALYPTGYSDRVDIYDTQSPNNPWTTATLSAPRYGIGAATLGNKAYFTGGGHWNLTTYFFDETSNKVDIFDPSQGLANAWSTQTLVKNRITHSCGAWGNKIVVGGGWRAEQNQVTGSVEILTDNSIIATQNPVAQNPLFLICPNPATDAITLSFTDKNHIFGKANVTITDISGKTLMLKTMNYNELQQSLNVSRLVAGFYILKIETDNGKVMSERFEVTRP